MENDIFSKISKGFSFNKKNKVKTQLNHKEDEIKNSQKLPSKESNYYEINEKLDKILEKENELLNQNKEKPTKPQIKEQENNRKETKKEEPILQSTKSFKELKNIISTRRSVRQFTEHKIPHKLIYEIIECATNSPKAGNVQTFHTTIVTDKQKIATLANLSYQQSWIAQAQTVLVISSSSDEMSKLYPDMSNRFSAQTTGAFIHSLLLLIHSAGFSSCWVESFQEEVIKSFMGIPKGNEIHAILPIGFAKEIPKKPIKGDLMMSISYESYGNKDNH